jgi:muramoyltetrapeptide carboxypeptidase
LASTGIGGWHAPNLTTFGRFGLNKAREAFSRLFGENNRPWVFPKEAVLRPGKAQGPLLGGNLTIFANLYGSRYCPSTEGSILLFEDVNEQPYSVDRLLTGLFLRGAFQGVEAVVFGSFENSGEDGLVLEVLSDFAKYFSVPVLSAAPFGHGEDNSPWFYGEMASIAAEPSGAVLKFSAGG